MQLKKKQAGAMATIILTGLFIITYTLRTIVQDNNDNRTNTPRIIETAKSRPPEEYLDIDNLHLIFEEISSLELSETQKNKKLTTYIYQCTPTGKTQDQNVFADFGRLLEENGYKLISESADGNGYINQYELLFQEIHYMIYTESSPDKIALSVLNYNEYL